MNSNAQLFAEFEKAYLTCGLWAEHGFEDYARAFLEDHAQVRQEIEQFFMEIRKDQDIYEEVLSRIEDAGHDFWLTRNGEGAGFWSRTGDHEWKYGDSLTKIASKFPPAHLLETDETGGFTYFSG